MIFEDKNSNDESSKKEDKKIIHSSYSKLFPKEIARKNSTKSYIETR
jgi:hypothetical protein